MSRSNKRDVGTKGLRFRIRITLDFKRGEREWEPLSSQTVNLKLEKTILAARTLFADLVNAANFYASGEIGDP